MMAMALATSLSTERCRLVCDQVPGWNVAALISCTIPSWQHLIAKLIDIFPLRVRWPKPLPINTAKLTGTNRKSLQLGRRIVFRLTMLSAWPGLHTQTGNYLPTLLSTEISQRSGAVDPSSLWLWRSFVRRCARYLTLTLQPTSPSAMKTGQALKRRSLFSESRRGHTGQGFTTTPV